MRWCNELIYVDAVGEACPLQRACDVDAAAPYVVLRLASSDHARRHRAHTHSCVRTGNSLAGWWISKYLSGEYADFKELEIVSGRTARTRRALCGEWKPACDDLRRHGSHAWFTPPARRRDETRAVSSGRRAGGVNRALHGLENSSITRSIWKMLGPFATTSRLTPIHQMSLAVLSRAACASMSTTTPTTTTTTRDRGDRYGPMEWAQQHYHARFRLRIVVQIQRTALLL